MSKRALTGMPASWVPGELVVRFADAATTEEKRRAHSKARSRVKNRIKALDVDVVKLPRGVPVAEAIAAYAADPEVVAAEPNYIRKRLGHVSATDPMFSDLWGLNNTGQAHAVGDPPPATASGTVDADIDAPEAWHETPGLPTTVIAVIDDGADITHPELDGSLWQNPGEVPGDGLDNDGNGRPDDVHGWDFAHNDNTLLAPESAEGGNAHGTHVAGTIAAELNNGVGVAGVCPNCRLMILKVMRDDGVLTLGAELQALAYAKAMGAHIVNMSIGAPNYSGAERASIATGDFLVVGAAGNDSLDNDAFLAFDVNGDGFQDIFSPSYPASYNLPNIVSVAASNHTDEYAYQTGCHADGFTKRECSFTNWGHDSVDLAAPGVDVTSTIPGASFETFDGTSMAAPHVSGAAGLVKSKFPLATPAEIKNRLMNGASTPTTLTTLHSQLFYRAKIGSFTRTNGRLNAADALNASTANATLVTDGNVGGTRRIASYASGTVRWPDDVNDVYRRYLSSRFRYRITLDGPRGRDFDLFIWKPGTKEIWQTCPTRWSCQLTRVAAGRSADETVTFRPPRNGTYYIHVNAWVGDAGRYALRIRRL